MKRLLIVSVLLLASLNTSLSSAYDRVTYIHSNGQGQPVAASDARGNLEWRAEYYPFGEEFSNTEVRRENDISYSGKPLDQEIGLSYFGARHYDPQIGRFTSIDPVRATSHNYLSFNRYAYANNNPYKYVDPNGEFPFLLPAVIFIGKEVAAEAASQATGGALDFLSFRRIGTKAVKQVVKAAKGAGGRLRPTQDAVSGPQVDRLAKDMKKNGFDPNSPVKVDGDLVADGHHRVMAADKAGVDIVTTPGTASSVQRANALDSFDDIKVDPVDWF